MVEELQQAIVEREQALYSDVVLHEASAPKNVGRMADADLRGIVQGWCGDTMEIYLRVDHSGSTQSPTIEKATFVTDGCGATIACGSLLTQMLTGVTLRRADWILPKDLIDALGGLPEESMHCAALAISTLQNALFNWRMNNGDGVDRESQEGEN
jgi:nitrogen fixation NifU-like protein